MASESYINTASETIQREMYDGLYNISHILNDLEGKISDRSIDFIIREIQVTPVGRITNPIPILTDANDSKLGQESFDPNLSRYGLEIFNLMVGSDSSIATKSISIHTDKISVILSRDLGYPATVLLSYVCIESLALYRMLVEYRDGDIITLTGQEMDRISNNMRYVTQYVSTKGVSHEVYEVLSNLRDMQRSMLFLAYKIPRVVGWK